MVVVEKEEEEVEKEEGEVEKEEEVRNELLTFNH